jgi:hypothetical protein
MPRALRLSLIDCQLLLFIEKNCAVPYEDWPKEYQAATALEKLRKRGHLTRKYTPNRYGLTRSGFSLARWIIASIEHTTAKDRN